VPKFAQPCLHTADIGPIRAAFMQPNGVVRNDLLIPEERPKQRRPGKYPAELRDRAVRMVFEAEQHRDNQWQAICSVAEKLGPTAETIRKWVRRIEIDEGRKPGLSSDERERLKQLEREVRELRRASEILKAASTFFAAELDSPGAEHVRRRVIRHPQ
jgi:transposase